MSMGVPTWVGKTCSLWLGYVRRCPKNAIVSNDETRGMGQYVDPASRSIYRADITGQ